MFETSPVQLRFSLKSREQKRQKKTLEKLRDMVLQGEQDLCRDFRISQHKDPYKPIRTRVVFQYWFIGWLF